MTKHRIRLYKAEYRCLVEALRRRVCFNRDPKKTITEQWTGLGCRTEYKQAETHGYMRIATAPNPGCMTWWALTPLGAAIVKQWLRRGFTPDYTDGGHGTPVNKQGEAPPRDLVVMV